MNDPLQELLSRLEDVRETRRGWIARCPAHEDSSPSLSIAEGRHQPVVLNCFAGCTAQEVAEAAGFDLADLCDSESDFSDYERTAYREKQQSRKRRQRREERVLARLKEVERLKLYFTAKDRTRWQTLIHLSAQRGRHRPSPPRDVADDHLLNRPTPKHGYCPTAVSDYTEDTKEYIKRELEAILQRAYHRYLDDHENHHRDDE